MKQPFYTYLYIPTATRIQYWHVGVIPAEHQEPLEACEAEKGAEKGEACLTPWKATTEVCLFVS